MRFVSVYKACLWVLNFLWQECPLGVLVNWVLVPGVRPPQVRMAKRAFAPLKHLLPGPLWEKFADPCSKL